MTPIFQTVVDKGSGNCEQAAIASLFDLDLTQVPNFILFPATEELHWWNVYFYFIYSLGYEVMGTGYPHSHNLKEQEGVGGFFNASVPSRTLEGCNHAVIIDRSGLVVHDPNPNQRWLGINVLETGELNHWSIIEKQKKDA